MTPQQLRDRRRLREQLDFYEKAVRQQQEQVRLNADAMARQEQIQGAINACIDMMVATINAPLYALMADIELSGRK